jgi:diaminopimelate decarboxylase
MMNIKNINSVIKRVKTPFYLYDSQILEENYSRLRTSIPKEIEIFYAIKANPNKNIIPLFANLGAGCDVASTGELNAALNSGVKPDKISFAGPGKTDEELKLAITKSIASISIESENEAHVIDKLAQKAKKVANVSIRVNPASGSLNAAIRMGGGSQQFGIDEELVPGVIKIIQGRKNLNFKGIHMHIGSQILSEETIANNIKYLLDYCIKLQKDMNIKISMINFGGGFGIPYYQEQKGLNIKLLGMMIKSVFYEKDTKLNFSKTRFIIEPGRFLVGEAGIYVTKILYKKVSRGKIFLIVDGGMHQNLAAAGLLGEGLRRNRILCAITKRNSKQKEIVTIAGCLCTPLDLLGHDISLPKCEPGDYLYITCSGAYGYSASPLMFLSHPIPKEIFI